MPDSEDRRPSRTMRGVLFDKDGTLLVYAATWLTANRVAALAAAGGDPIGGHPGRRVVKQGAVLVEQHAADSARGSGIVGIGHRAVNLG